MVFLMKTVTISTDTAELLADQVAGMFDEALSDHAEVACLEVLRNVYVELGCVDYGYMDDWITAQKEADDND